MKTVKEVCDEFFRLENEHNLNYIMIQKVYPWELVRLYLYYEITRKLGLFDSAQQASVSLFDKVKSFLPFIKNSIFYNPSSGKSSYDVLIFNHPRKVLNNGEYMDIYSYFLRDTLDKIDKDYEIIDSPYLNKHYIKKDEHVKFNDRILLGSYFYKKTHNIEYTLEEEDTIRFIEELIRTHFNVDVNLFEIFSNHILNFKYEFEKYRELLIEKQVKQVYVVVAYENKALIAACKDLKIDVLELQHGVISKYHLGYSYPSENITLKSGTYEHIAYFPDKILSFGDYWRESSAFPIKKHSIFSVGFPYFEDNSKKFKDTVKKDNQILFISQGVIGKYLSDFASELAEKLDGYEFIYKLHPGEYSTWRVNYPKLVEAEKLDNFRIVDSDDPELYALFAESEYQVGAFSTAIYEGLAFNCKTFIVDVPGVEYLDDLVDKKIVVKVRNPNDMIRKLDDLDLSSYDADFFFKDYDEQLIEDIILNDNIVRISEK
jgi:hypothetical protein